MTKISEALDQYTGICKEAMMISRFNVSLALRYFGSDGRKAIAIDPSYISKSGKKTPHIGRFWSGCAGAVRPYVEFLTNY